MKLSQERAHAFNQGADARHMAIPINMNPYVAGMEEFASWRAGWLDVDRNFGAWARWPVKKLPNVVRI